MSKLEDIFSPLKVRAAVLRTLFGLSTRPMYIAEIERTTGFANRSVEVELRKLKKLDLLVSTRDMSRVYYSANTANPLYADLHNIVLKTAGLGDLVREALSSAHIEYAFIFGSLAAQTERAESDLDLMIIGSVTHRDLASPLRALTDKLGREINPHFLTVEELTRRLVARDHFLRDVISKPKLFIIGDEHGFAAMVEKHMAQVASDKSRGDPIALGNG
jgi:predicted nucleotidyltransferase